MATNPVLQTLVPGDSFLFAEWTNGSTNPATDLFSAFLLVIDISNAYSSQYIYLSEGEALRGNYKIEGLRNGCEYIVQYTQVQTSADGTQLVSNSQNGTPIPRPSRPIIVADNPTYYPIVVDSSDNASVYTLYLWVNYGSVSQSSPPLEKTVFKVVNNTAKSILTFSKDVNTPYQQYQQYVLTDLSAGMNTVVCYNVSDNGISQLSFPVHVAMAQIPFVCDVTRVTSGYDRRLYASINTPQNMVTDCSVNSILIECSRDFSFNTIDGSYNYIVQDSDITTNSVIVLTDISANTSFLENGTNEASKTGYYVRARAHNTNGYGPVGITGVGTPAVKTTLTNLKILMCDTSSNALDASWNRVGGTMPDPSYNYVVYDEATNIANGSTRLGSIDLTNVPNMDLNDRISLTTTITDFVQVPSMWTYPALTEVNQWIDSASYNTLSLPYECDVIQVTSGQGGQLTVDTTSPNNNTTNIVVQCSISATFTTIDGSYNHTVISTNISSNLVSVTAVVTGLLNNTGYYVRAYAVNAAGNGPFGIQGTGVPMVKSTISDLSFNTCNASATINNIIVSWARVDVSNNSVEDPIYNYQFTGNYTASSTTSSLLISVSSNSLTAGQNVSFSMTITDVITNLLKPFWMYPALTGTNLNYWDDNASALTASHVVNSAPPPPSNLFISNISPASLTYGWTAPSGGGDYNAVTSYTIVMNNVPTTEITYTSVTFSNLTNGTNYSISSLVAVNEYGSSTEIYDTNLYTPYAALGTVQGLTLSQDTTNATILDNDLNEIASWTTFSQTGYTLVNYSVELYEKRVISDNVIDTLFLANLNVNDTSNIFEITNADAHLGNSFYFKIKANMLLTGQNGFNNDGEIVSTNYSTSGMDVFSTTPVISSVTFSVDDSANGTAIITVDAKGAPLTGLVCIVFPKTQNEILTQSENIIKQVPINNTEIHSSTYNVFLGYGIPTNNDDIPENVSFIVMATNKRAYDIKYANLGVTL